MGAMQWQYNRKHSLLRFPKDQLRWYRDYHQTCVWAVAQPNEPLIDIIQDLATSMIRHALEVNATQIRITAGVYGYETKYLVQDKWSESGSAPGFFWPSLKTYFCWMSNQEASLHTSECSGWTLAPLLYAIGLNTAIQPGKILVLYRGKRHLLRVEKEPQGMLDGLDIFLVKLPASEVTATKVAPPAPSPRAGAVAKRPT
jgi:hypothetical protein